MIKDINEIRETLVAILNEHMGALRARHDSFEKYEICGCKEVMQGKQKVDGHYFASVIPKAKDVRLYYFPIYTHKDNMGTLSEPLGKMLKGKSCFHIKYMDDAIKKEITSLVSKGVKAYKSDGLI